MADAYSAEDDLLALELTLVIVQEGAASLQYADDSGGSLGGLVEDAIQQLEEIVESLQQQDVSVPLRTGKYGKICA